MKSRIKRVLSLLTALAIVCSFAVIPAGAAGSTTMSVREIGWNGDTLTVEVYAAGGDLAGVSNYGFELSYNAEALTFGSAEKVDSFDVRPVAGAAGGVVTANAADAVDYPSANGEIALARLTFKAAADAETQDTELKILAGEKLVLATAEDGDYSVSVGAPLSVHVTGQPPMLDVLEMNGTVEVDGQNVTVNAQAKSTKGAVINGAVDWSITPANDDVSIDGGVITVSGSAKNGTYTVTATPKSGEARGDAKTATLTVTRADERQELVVEGPSTITVPKEAGKTSSASYKALLTNQFHDDPVETDGVAWSVSSAEGVEIDPATGIVTVTSAATPKTNITITATKGELTKEFPVRLVDIELTVTPKTDAAYGDTWTEILPVSGMTAKMGDQNLTITGAARTINGQNVDAAKPVPGAYSVDVTVQTAEGEATVTVPVTVGKLTINPKLDNQEFEYTGEPINAKDVEYTVEKTGEKVVLTASNAEDCVNYAEDGYDVTYTLDADKYPNYILGKVEGGRLMITKVEVASKNVDASALNGVLVDDEFEIELDENGNLSVRAPSDAYSLNQVQNILKSATEDVVLTVKDGKDTHRFTITGWVLDGKDSEFDNTGINVFVPSALKGEDKAAEDFLKNHAPALTFTVKLTASGSSGGSYGGASTGWDWGDRGNQTINLTPQSIFTDVPDGHTFQKDIVWVYYRGIMKGTTETTFSPASSTNRQQLWMVLGRISGSSPADMAMAREWAVNTGVSDGSKPTGSLTRQQMVTMLYRWAQSKGYVGVTTGSIAGYNDASSVASYAKDAMTWAVGNGIINGSGNNLNPGGTATRGQFAAIMHRFCEKFGV